MWSGESGIDSSKSGMVDMVWYGWQELLAIRSLLGDCRSGVGLVEWRISDFDTQDCATVMTFGDDDICLL